MPRKWNRKEEKQTEHPGQMELDFCPTLHSARPDKSETGSGITEDQFKKELT